jgi:hypothetical protein
MNGGAFSAQVVESLANVSLTLPLVDTEFQNPVRSTYQEAKGGSPVHIRVLCMIAVLFVIRLPLAAEQLEEHTVQNAIPTPPIFQNPFMALNNFSGIHLNSYQTDTTSTRGPASARRQTVQQELLRPITMIAGTMAFNRTGSLVARSRVPWSNLLGGALANNFYSGIGIGPDRTAYVGVFGGIVAWRPQSGVLGDVIGFDRER